MNARVLALRRQALYSPPLMTDDEHVWKQSPAWTSITIVDGTAVMSFKTFESLSDYSCTIPSGTIIGKRWRRREPYGGPGEWWMGEYAETNPPDPNRVNIIWRAIHVYHTTPDAPRRCTDSVLNSFRTVEALSR